MKAGTVSTLKTVELLSKPEMSTSRGPGFASVTDNVLCSPTRSAPKSSGLAP
jgi:hypothetical protein